MVIKKIVSQRIFGSLVIGILSLVLMQGCAKQKKKEDLSAKELKTKAMACLQKKDYDHAAAYLEQLVTQYSDHTNIAQYKLLLGECYFKAEKYPLAYQMCEHFNQFYPSDKRAEYAKYKALLAKFYQTIRTDCDQTETEETVRLSKEYLDKTIYAQYRDKVTDIKKACEQKLIDKEIYVFNFYVKQARYDAADSRLKYIKKTFLANNPTLEARLLYLECKLAQKQKNEEKIKESIEKLLTQYPESQFTQMAQALTTKSPFFF